MTRIILMRHGQSEANRARIFAGYTNVPLTERGHAQAAATAAYLAATEQVDAVYASNLTRAMETARPAAEAFGLSIAPVAALREIFAGEWEGLPFSLLERHPRYAPHRAQWHTDLASALCTGGETVAEVYERVIPAVTRIAAANEGNTVLIAAHWTPIMAMLCHATVGAPSRIGECPEPANASLQFLRFENGVFTPERLNVTDHLEGLGGETHL